MRWTLRWTWPVEVFAAHALPQLTVAPTMGCQNSVGALALLMVTCRVVSSHNDHPLKGVGSPEYKLGRQLHVTIACLADSHSRVARWARPCVGGAFDVYRLLDTR